PRGDRADPTRRALIVGVHQEIELQPTRSCIAEGDHLTELPPGIDVQQREWWLSGIKCLARQMHHNSRILADRIKHHRVTELRYYLAHDADRLGFQTLQMLGLHTGRCRTLGDDSQGTSFLG